MFASEFDEYITNDPNWDEANPNFNLLDNLNARKMDCPNFANWGCFAANFTEGEFSNTAVLGGFNKGRVTERLFAESGSVLDPGRSLTMKRLFNVRAISSCN